MADRTYEGLAGVGTTDLGTLREQGPPLRVLHSADLHLGGSPAASHAFEALVRSAIDHQVDMLLLAGDIYDRADREVSSQLVFLAGLRRLAAAGIHVFIVHGNHDPLVGRFDPVGDLPPEVHVFAAGAPHTFEFRVAGRTVAVTGLSFATRHEHENLAARIAAVPSAADLHIGLVHANVAGIPGHDDYAGCREEHLADASVHYWALGHIHHRTVRKIAAGRWWAYPGNLQGRSTKASECGPKGALLVEAGAVGFDEPIFVPCDHERFALVDVDASGAESVDAVLAIVADRLEEAKADADGRRLFARLTISGSTPVGSALSSLGIEEVVAHTGTEVEITAYAVTTSLPADRKELAARTDVVGAVLRRVDALTAPELDAAVERASRSLSSTGRRAAVGSLEDGRMSGPELLAEVERLMLAELTR